MDWIGTRHATRDLDVALLNKALVDIDLAGVYTIHGFCQRILTEFPLESQQSFDLTLSNEAALLKEQIVHDFWRQFTYDLTPMQAGVFSQLETSPETLVEWLKEIGQSEVVLLRPKRLSGKPFYKPLRCTPKRLTLGTHEKLSAGLVQLKSKIQSKRRQRFQNLSSKFLELTAFSTFNELLSGTQFRDKGEQTGEERRSDFWDTFVTMFQPPIFAAQAYQEALPSLEVSLKHALYRYYRAELTQRLDAQGVLGFDDLILRLAQILSNEEACGDMKQAIQQRYGAALIDEFQDTDAEQWHIFHRLFGSGHHYLYLIGDTKQAIYKFRGADIDTYIEAVNQADVALTLGFNWRSAPNLVAATNELFNQKVKTFGNVQHPFKTVDTGVK